MKSITLVRKDKKLSDPLTGNLKFNKNYSIDFSDSIGEHKDYKLKISYTTNDTNDNEQSVTVDIPVDFKILSLQNLEVKNVFAKQIGYNKAQIKFDINEIVDEQ